ncbi:hypothetical protein MOSE0_M05072 [Monosporozyma servazzii]
MNKLQTTPDSIRPIDTNNSNSNNIPQTNGQSLPSIATMLTQNMTGAPPPTLPRHTSHLDVVSQLSNNSPASASIPINQPHNNYATVTSNTQQSQTPDSVQTRVYTLNQHYPQYIETYPTNMNLQQSSVNGNISLQPHIVTSIISNNNQIHQPQMQQQNVILTQQLDYNNNSTILNRGPPMSPPMSQPQFYPNQQQYYIVSQSVMPSHNIIQQPMNFNLQTQVSQQPQSKPQPVSVISVENPPPQQMEYYGSQTIPATFVYPVIKLQSNTEDSKPTQMSPPQPQLEIRSPMLTNQKEFIKNHVKHDSYSSSNIQLTKQAQHSQPRQRFRSYPQIGFNELVDKVKPSLDGEVSPIDDSRKNGSNSIVSGNDPTWLSDSYSDSYLNKSINENHESTTYEEKEKVKLVDSNGNVLIKKNLDAMTLKSKQCPICGKKCSRPSILKTHYFIHTGEAPYKCTWPACGKTFNVKSNMVRHLRAHESMESQSV